MFAIVLLLLLVLLLFFWLWVKKTYSYFSDRGILHAKPRFPLGNIQTLNTIDDCMNLGSDQYLRFRGRDVFFGTYVGLLPALVITDLDLIRDIIVRDFNNFTDHTKLVQEEIYRDPLGPSLYTLQGESWRQMRTKISSVYSVASVDGMFEMNKQCAMSLSDYVVRNLATGPHKPINAQDVCLRYVCDALGSSGFGMDCRGTTDEDPVLLKIAHGCFNPSKAMIWFYALLYPYVVNWLPWNGLTDDTREFLRVIDEIVKYREVNGVRRNDILQAWMDVNRNENIVDDESGELLAKSQPHGLHAESFLLFFFSYHTTRSVMASALYELAANPAIQERARDEITRVLSDNESFDCSTLDQMVYLQQIVDGEEEVGSLKPVFKTFCNFLQRH